MLRADSEGRPRIGMPLAYARKRTWQAQGLPHHRRRTTWGGGAGGFAQCQEECTFDLKKHRKSVRRSPILRSTEANLGLPSLEEAKAVLALRSQFVTLKRGEHLKYAPYVFTEHGAVMLANVLKSPVAVRASIQVVRAFVRLRQMLATNEDLARKIEAIERKVGKHDSDLESILRILKQLLVPPPPAEKRPIGFVSSPKTRKDG
jgi:hypothetical protein